MIDVTAPVGGYDVHDLFSLRVKHQMDNLLQVPDALFQFVHSCLRFLWPRLNVELPQRLRLLIDVVAAVTVRFHTPANPFQTHPATKRLQAPLSALHTQMAHRDAHSVSVENWCVLPL